MLKVRASFSNIDNYILLQSLSIAACLWAARQRRRRVMLKAREKVSCNMKNKQSQAILLIVMDIVCIDCFFYFHKIYSSFHSNQIFCSGQDYSLVAPIRQTASIFKQPVTVFKEHKSKVKFFLFPIFDCYITL